jgi:hypothetical protein
MGGCGGLSYLVRGGPVHLSSLHRRRKTRGQALVEFALTLPILLLLLLIALDFGRAFFGWVALNNAARVGANYAAAHPSNWDAGTTYEDLMAANLDLINCNQTNAGNPPAFGPTKLPGELVRVNLDCDFTVVTPIISAVFGNGGVITVSSSAAFPITDGCLAACPTGTPPPPPPPPPTSANCRTVPAVVDLSVAGARAAWIAAGFRASNFTPPSGTFDTRTVTSQTVTEPTNGEGCVNPKRFFEASMTVDIAPLVTPPPTATCRYVPNLKGITLSAARTAWSNAGFTGGFLPNGSNSDIVLTQTTNPASSPGACLEPPASVTVTHGNAPPPPTPLPCKVPSFANTSSTAAVTTWTDAGFTKNKLDFKPKPPNNGYTIISQTLVGGTYVGCDSSILLSSLADPNS